MEKRTRSAGFRRLGQVDTATLGLPPAKARQLLLEHAWARVAGEGIARHARAEAIRRGVVEIAVDDPRWGSEIRALLPRLAGRLARDFPELGVKRFRVAVAGTPGSAAAEVPQVEEPDEAEAPATPDAPPTPAAAELTTGRLVGLAQRYLERAREQKGAGPTSEERPDAQE